MFLNLNNEEKYFNKQEFHLMLIFFLNVNLLTLLYVYASRIIIRPIVYLQIIIVI